MTTATRERSVTDSIEKRGHPVPIETAEDDLHGSLWLHLDGQWQKASSMDNLWEISEAWWNGRPVIKMYFRVTTQDQSQFIIFQDLLEGTWYREEFGDEEASQAADQPTTATNQQAARKTAKIDHRAA